MWESIEPVESFLLIEVEHPKIRVEQFLNKELEELFPHSPFIYAWLSIKYYF